MSPKRKKKMKVLTIPDVHGRKFWLTAVEQHIDDCDKVVFLGDYLDPYTFFEGITKREAIENFKEMLEFAEKHTDKVVMLLGNHDITYISQYFYRNADGGRHDKKNEHEIKSLFRKHLDLFRLIYEAKNGSGKVWFSHAGITRGWYEAHKEFFGTENNEAMIPERINKCFKDNPSCAFLTDISAVRGGRQMYGSMVWADVEEHEYSDGFEGAYQVFGHTQPGRYPIISDKYACLDCHRTFIVNVNDNSKITIDEIQQDDEEQRASQDSEDARKGGGDGTQ